MRSQIRLQAIRLAVVFAMLAGLIVWQRHFILEGIEANPYLNLIIIGAFLFTAIHACISLAQVSNEERAFRALQEVYRDVVEQRSVGELDPLWRHDRCRRPGTVFSSPKLLGHVYDLTLEELLRTRHMRISLETMQSLVHAIEQRIAADRSLIVYMTGLSVFLGLIGTFIGLMEMVGSVGRIIGSLAASGGNDPQAMNKLIRDLEGPLVGMATGFSSSLFGLFASLVLGLIGRFVNQAALGVKDEFEGWLAGISQIENEATGAPGHGKSAPGTALAAATDPALLIQLRRSGDALERAATTVKHLVDRHADSTAVLVRATAQTETVSVQLIELTRAVARVDDLAVELAREKGALQSMEERIAGRVQAGLDSLEARAVRRHEDGIVELRDGLAHQKTAAAVAAARLRELAEETAASRRVQDETREEVRSGWNLIRDESNRLAESVVAALHRAAELGHAALARVEPRLGVLESRSDTLAAHAGRVEETLEQLLGCVGMQGSVASAQADLLRRVASGQEDGRAILDDIARRAEHQPQALAVAIGTGLAAVAKAVEDLERAARRDSKVQSEATSHELRAALRSVEEGLSGGFAELARSFETNFLSFAELLRALNAEPGDAARRVLGSRP